MKFQVFLFLFIATATFVDAQKKLVCYWFGKMSIAQVDPSICTHIIYSFLGVDAQGGVTYLNRGEAEALGYINELVALKQQRPGLKVLAAIGGAIDNSPWADVTANADLINNFASNVLTFLQTNNLDGIDIDWEYPNNKANFVSLLQALKETLGSSFSMSVALGSGEWRTGISYDLPQIAANVDFINLMTYDLHGGWESKTGIHAGLYRSALDNTASNVDESVKILLNAGVDKSKVIVGIPSYGNAFTLADANNNGVGASASGAGNADYREICQKTQSGALTYRWDDTQKVPYAFSGTYWVGYDDVKSVTLKANYIKNNNLGGGMFWALDDDDYSNVCGGGKFPLITAVYNIVVGGAAPPVNPPPASTATTLSTTNQPTVKPSIPASPPSSGPFICPGNGVFKDSANPTKFYICGNNVAYSMLCGPGLVFNDAIKSCDWPSNIVGPSPTAATVAVPVTVAPTQATTSASTTTTTPTTTKPATTSTTIANPSGSSPFTCPGSGLFKNPADCSKYFNCANNIAYPSTCGSGLLFNDIAKVCDWPANVKC